MNRDDYSPGQSGYQGFQGGGFGSQGRESWQGSDWESRGRYRRLRDRGPGRERRGDSHGDGRGSPRQAARRGPCRAFFGSNRRPQPAPGASGASREDLQPGGRLELGAAGAPNARPRSLDRVVAAPRPESSGIPLLPARPGPPGRALVPGRAMVCPRSRWPVGLALRARHPECATYGRHRDLPTSEPGETYVGCPAIPAGRRVLAGRFRCASGAGRPHAAERHPPGQLRSAERPRTRTGAGAEPSERHARGGTPEQGGLRTARSSAGRIAGAAGLFRRRRASHPDPVECAPGRAASAQDHSVSRVSDLR